MPIAKKGNKRRMYGTGMTASILFSSLARAIRTCVFGAMLELARLFYSSPGVSKEKLPLIEFRSPVKMYEVPASSS
ncbi:hypothetical protein B0T18DRAFT_412453 [Schizothecium vesticola]|uniref:Uncharacterized protein n=1 Tax=Schizothecium vesticola TaxID=314040 RepID=A0AA40EWQ1_9PEZI|nr:hypothetical protein B0T18DRAFT_412453 [Schizothecium vesticola]